MGTAILKYDGLDSSIQIYVTVNIGRLKFVYEVDE